MKFISLSIKARTRPRGIASIGRHYPDDGRIHTTKINGITHYRLNNADGSFKGWKEWDEGEDDYQSQPAASAESKRRFEEVCLLLKDIRLHYSKLTDWERNFINHLAPKYFHILSKKQMDVLLKIKAKYSSGSGSGSASGNSSKVSSSPKSELEEISLLDSLKKINTESLTDWEKNFISSILNFVKSGRTLSDKQQAVVLKIFKKQNIDFKF